MINQQLLDFIKSQLSKGTDKETITKELLGSGWTQSDIDEGFNTVNTPVINPIVNPVINPIVNPVISSNINNSILTQTTNHSGKKVLLIIIALFIIAGGVSGYYFRNDIPIIKDLIKTKALLPVNQIKQEGNTQPQIQKEETVIPQQEQNKNVTGSEPVQQSEPVVKTEDKKVSTKNNLPQNTIKTGQIDCGKDMTCFLNATKTCSLAIVEQDQTVDEHVFNRTERRRMTLTGFNPSKNCGFISQIINSTVDYTTEYKTQPVYKNLTNEEKQQWLIRTNAEVRDTIGDTFTCEIPFNSLVDLITNYSKGIYSNSSGFASGSCENSKVVIPN